MWQYLIFNSLWFLLLFLARFSRQAILKNFVFMIIIAAAAMTAFRTSIDPFSWLYYFIFSLVVFYGAERFRIWVHAKSLAQEEQMRVDSKKLENERGLLAEESEAAGALADRANQIALLYDRIKEMSQSLEPFETFLVFGETLLKFCRFGSIRLALFNEEQANPRVPDELFELRYVDLQNMIDRSALLKEKHPARSQVFPLDQKLYEWIFKNRIPLKCLDSRSLIVDETFELPADAAPLMAYPVFIHKKIYAVLTLLQVDREDLSMLNILIERFLSELQRVRLYQKVEMLAITDGLTGLYVRRHLLERLEGELLRCKKFDTQLSFLMIDVDYFKNFNDQYGHLVGDVVLKQAADTITKNIRELDLAGRYGGEEFGVILVDTDEAGAFFVAERICRAVAEKVYRAYDENLKVTISIGCSTYSSKLNQAHLLVDAADSALYQAKQQGRNRVCAANLAEP